MSIVAKGIKSLFQGLGSLLGGGVPDPPAAPKPPPPPPTTPTRADASASTSQGSGSNVGLSSLISTGSSGLQKKANTGKRSLLGGS